MHPRPKFAIDKSNTYVTITKEVKSPLVASFICLLPNNTKTRTEKVPMHNGLIISMLQQRRR